MEDRTINKELFSVKEPSPWKPWLIAAFAAAVILGIAIILMSVTGLFKIPHDDAGTKTIAAALALVGSVLAASITLIGTVVKYSIDDRNARLASTESARNYAVALETEKRNRIDTAIRAVDLLCENNKDTTPNQIGGALLALVNLGELELAISLLSQFWPDELVSPYVACSIVEAALNKGTEENQISACLLLHANAKHIHQEGYNIWPISEVGWNTELPEVGRIGLVKAATEWLKCELEVDNKSIPDAAAVLYKALFDPNHIVNNIAASCLRPLAKVIQENKWLYIGGEQIFMKEIREGLRKFPGPPITQSGSRIETEVLQLLNVDK